MALLDEIASRRKAIDTKTDKVVAKLTALLKKVQAEAKAKLETLKDYTDADGKLVDNREARARVKAIVADLQSAIKEQLSKADTILEQTKAQVFKDEYLAHSKTIKAETETLKVGTTTSQMFRRAAKESASKPVVGVKPSKKFEGSEEWTNERIESRLTEAIVNGESVEDTSRKLAEDLEISQRAAERIARTNINASVNDAHMAIYNENEDVFDGYVWDATLDQSTSLICAQLHGTFFPLGSKPPGPPAHPNCRSVLVGHFKDPDVQALQDADTRRVRDLNPDGGRANETQLISNATRYDQWLATQPPEATKKITGSETKDKLWREGKLNFDELTHEDFTTRTDEEAVQLALAKSPDDKELKALAKELGVEEKSLEQIVEEERQLQARFEKMFDYGQGPRDGSGGPPPPPPPEKPPEPPPEPPKSSGIEDLPLDIKSSEEKTEDLVRAFTAEVERQQAEATEAYSKAITNAEAMYRREASEWRKTKAFEDELEALRKAGKSSLPYYGGDRYSPELTRAYDEAFAIKEKLYKVDREAVDKIMLGKLESKFVGEAPEIKTLKSPTYASAADRDLFKTKDPTRLKQETEKVQGQIKDVLKYVDAEETVVAGRALEVGISPGRAYYVDHAKGAHEIVTPGDFKTTAHEFAHYLETQNPHWYKAAEAFRERRATSPKLVKMSTLTGNKAYKDDEVALPDNFVTPYVGKVYAQPGSTEVISVGVERMLTSPLSFAKEDPEHFALIWDLMKGRRPK